MTLNGVLAGLVGITAGADTVSILGSVLIGGIAGLIVVGSVLFFDRIRIDDPVGAISVHLTCGIFGTLAVGMFGSMASWEQFWIQLVGVATCGGFAFSTASGSQIPPACSSAFLLPSHSSPPARILRIPCSASAIP